MRSPIAIILTTSLLVLPARAEEENWTPQQVIEQDQAWVTKQGFGLPLDRLWNEKAGGGLLANAVQLPLARSRARAGAGGLPGHLRHDGR